MQWLFAINGRREHTKRRLYAFLRLQHFSLTRCHTLSHVVTRCALNRRRRRWISMNRSLALTKRSEAYRSSSQASATTLGIQKGVRLGEMLGSHWSMLPLLPSATTAISHRCQVQDFLRLSLILISLTLSLYSSFPFLFLSFSFAFFFLFLSSTLYISQFISLSISLYSILLSSGALRLWRL